MKCAVCDREILEKGFCLMHIKAFENLVENYHNWKKALGISWREYLSEIEHNPLTGEWAIEVAGYLAKNEERSNGKEI